LSNEELKLFALHEQTYLIKQVREKSFQNVTGPNKISLESLGMVCSWLFYFQRSDVNLRNEWSNYTNWPYNYLPINSIPAPTTGNYVIYRKSGNTMVPVAIGPGVNPNGTPTGLLINPQFNAQNDKQILIALGILLNGSYRENVMPVGIFDLIQKYNRTTGNAPSGLYCYNFSLNTNNKEINPSGAINMSTFKTIQLEFTTILPPLNPLAQSMNICDPETGAVVGVNKPTWRIYEYNFDLIVFEERYNFLHIVGGNAGLKYAT